MARVDPRQPVAHRLELLLAPAGQSDRRALGRVASEVLRGQAAGEAGGAEEDEVVGRSGDDDIIADRASRGGAGSGCRRDPADTAVQLTHGSGLEHDLAASQMPGEHPQRQDRDAALPTHWS